MSTYSNIVAKMDRDRRKVESKVHLQGIGEVPGMLSGEIQVGDIESRNYSYRCYEVVEITRETAKTIWYKVKDRKDGKVWGVKRRKSSLAPVERLEGGVK